MPSLGELLKQGGRHLQTGGGEDDGVVFAGIKLFQAGIEIATQGLNHQLRKACRNQGLTAQAAGADDSTSFDSLEEGVHPVEEHDAMQQQQPQGMPGKPPTAQPPQGSTAGTGPIA